MKIPCNMPKVGQRLPRALETSDSSRRFNSVLDSTTSVRVSNLLHHVCVSPIDGMMSSKLFGELQTRRNDINDDDVGELEIRRGEQGCCSDCSEAEDGDGG